MSKKVYAKQVNPEFQGDFISDIFAYDEAFNKYKTEKEKYIKEIADEYKCKIHY